MNIIVCVKQVPGAASVEIDSETGVLKREGAEAKLNPYDLFAIEAALTLAESTNGRVTAISMGPPQARNALLETIYMGVGQAVLISDGLFAGSDVLATAFTLSQAVSAISKNSPNGFDLIICGKQTTDGDTAQVGPELAEFLDIPHATGVLSITPEDKGVVALLGRDNNIIKQYMPAPCLLCTDGGINTPRLPSYKRKREITADPVQIMTVSDFGNQNTNNYGLKGSPTQVERTFTPETSVGRETITGGSARVADRLADILAELKYI